MIKFRFKDTSASFMTDGVSPGDRFYAYSDVAKTVALKLVDKHSGGYMVWGIETDDTLWLYPVNSADVAVDYTDITYSSADPIYYDIKRDLTKNQQADAIAAVAESYNQKRVFLIWPDVTLIETDGEDSEEPAYYTCAAIAGLIAGLPPQYPFSGLGLSGMSGVKHSNDYFSEAQLDKMADAGVFIVTQTTPESLPVVRHQLSTDTDTLETKELSIVKDVDWYSLFMKASLVKFTKGYNIYDDTIKMIHGTCDAINEEVVNDYVVPKAGPVMTEAKLVSVRANLHGENEDLAKDEIEAINEVQPPYPCNKILVRVRI